MRPICSREGQGFKPKCAGRDPVFFMASAGGIQAPCGGCPERETQSSGRRASEGRKLSIESSNPVHSGSHSAGWMHRRHIHKGAWGYNPKRAGRAPGNFLASAGMSQVPRGARPRKGNPIKREASQRGTKIEHCELKSCLFRVAFSGMDAP